MFSIIKHIVLTSLLLISVCALFAQQDLPARPDSINTMESDVLHNDAPNADINFVHGSTGDLRGTYYRFTNYSEYDYDTGAGEYVGNDSIDYVYDAQNRLSLQTTYNYYEVGGVWRPNTKYTYTFSGDTSFTFLQVWDDINSQWDNYSNSYAILNADGNITYRYTEAWNGSSWEPSIEYIYQYDNNGWLTSYQYNNGNPLTPNYRYTYIYDSNGNVIEDQKDEWSTAQMMWIPDYRSTTVFDANNNPTTITDYDWDDMNSLWLPTNRTIYTYTVDGNRLSSLYQNYDSGTQQWVNDGKEERLYNSNGRPTDSYTYTWNGFSWDSTNHFIWQYDGNGNNTLYQQYIYNGWSLSWNPVRRYIFTFDANNNRTVRLVEDFDLGLMTWVGYDRDTYEHDANNNTKQHTDFSFNSSLGVFEPNYRERWWYEAYQVGVGITTPVTNTSVTVYPQPAHGTVNLRINKLPAGTDTLTIYDMNGKQVHHQSVFVSDQSPTLLQWHPLQPGIYLYQLTVNDAVLSGQLITQ